MKTIQVMQQSIFFYFGIDLRTTFQSPTQTGLPPPSSMFPRHPKGAVCRRAAGHAKDFLRKNSFKMAAEEFGKKWRKN